MRTSLKSRRSNRKVSAPRPGAKTPTKAKLRAGACPFKEFTREISVWRVATSNGWHGVAVEHEMGTGNKYWIFDGEWQEALPSGVARWLRDMRKATGLLNAEPVQEGPMLNEWLIDVTNYCFIAERHMGKQVILPALKPKIL